MLAVRTIAALTQDGGSVDFSSSGGLEYNYVRVSGAAEIRERKYIDETAPPYVISRGAGAERIELNGGINLTDSSELSDILKLYALNGQEVNVRFRTDSPAPYNSIHRIYQLIFVNCGGAFFLRNARYRSGKLSEWTIQLVYVRDDTPATQNPTE